MLESLNKGTEGGRHSKQETNELIFYGKSVSYGGTKLSQEIRVVSLGKVRAKLYRYLIY